MKFFLILLITLNCAMAHGLWQLRGGEEAIFLDIGQGDAVLLISEEEHHVLVDGGPGNSVLGELAAVLPYSFRKIDLLVLTHPHLDHMEGLISVLQRFEVGAVLLSAPAYESQVYEAFLAELQDVPIYFAEADTDFQLGSLHLDVLFPFEPETGVHMENINNASPVIRVNEWLLLTGDAEQEVEAELLAAGVDVEARVLKAGHHGSRTSSSAAFLDAVQPEVMVINCGEGNSFGHPHPETLEKAADRDLQVRRTDLEGRIRIDAESVRPET